MGLLWVVRSGRGCEVSPMLLVEDGASGKGLDPLVDCHDVHDHMGKLSVEAPR